MGLELMCYPVFRRSLEEMSQIFWDLGAQWSLIGEN